VSDYPTKLEDLNKARDGAPLICHGCAHSAGNGAFPGRPSGERPCLSCTRNVQREQWLKDADSIDPEHGKALREHVVGHWYNGKAMKKVPMDLYISTDRLMDGVPPGSHIIT
jgi:hypothetical protein